MKSKKKSTVLKVCIITVSIAATIAACALALIHSKKKKEIEEADETTEA